MPLHFRTRTWPKPSYKPKSSKRMYSRKHCQKCAVLSSLTLTLRLTRFHQKEDYHQRCNQRVSVYMATIQERQKGRDAQPTIESSSMPAPKPQQVGPFPNCTYHETGSFSTVYRHEGLDPPRVLAIKVASDFKTQHHSAKREARILSKASHENIIPLLETYQLASSFILVFPFQPLDLARLLAAGPIQILQARSVLRNVFSALAHVHGLNIIHRDIKPSNILLTTANGPAYLADFGIAWMAGEKTSEAEDCKITDVGYVFSGRFFGQNLQLQ